MSKVIPGLRWLEELVGADQVSQSLSLSLSPSTPSPPSLPLLPHSLSTWLPWAYSKQDSLRILEFLTWQLEQKQKLSGVFKTRPRAFNATSTTCYWSRQSQGSMQIEAKREKYQPLNRRVAENLQTSLIHHRLSFLICEIRPTNPVSCGCFED